jgi:hypothetical protein
MSLISVSLHLFLKLEINCASFGPLFSAIAFAISQPHLFIGVFESQLKPIKGIE